MSGLSSPSDAPPQLERRPVGSTPVEKGLHDDAVPTARIGHRAAIALVVQADGEDAVAPAQEVELAARQGHEELGLVVVLTKGPRLFAAIDLPPRAPGVAEEGQHVVAQQGWRQRELEAHLELRFEIAPGLGAGHAARQVLLRHGQQVVGPVRQQRKGFARGAVLAGHTLLEQRQLAAWAVEDVLQGQQRVTRSSGGLRGRSQRWHGNRVFAQAAQAHVADAVAGGSTFGLAQQARLVRAQGLGLGSGRVRQRSQAREQPQQGTT
jgi:hypothetical protein